MSEIPTEDIAGSLLIGAPIVIAALLLMAGIYVGLKPQGAKVSLASAPEVKPLRLADPVLPTKSDVPKTKKHWTGVKRLASNDLGWGFFLSAAGISVLVTALSLIPFMIAIENHQWGWEFVGSLFAYLPFACATIGGWYVTATSFMQLRNPILHLGLTENPIPIGGRAALVWEVDGDASRINNLKFELHGTQSTYIYEPPGDERSSEELFEVIPIHEASKPKEIRSGSVMLSIPDSTIHSLKSGNDQIIWTIKVTGEIPRWVGLDVSYPIAIVPPALPETNQKSRANVHTRNEPSPPIKNGAFS